MKDNLTEDVIQKMKDEMYEIECARNKFKPKKKQGSNYTKPKKKRRKR
jgi:hypothetical protein